MPRFMPKDSPQLGVVVPLKDEAANLGELYRRLTTRLDELGLPYELLFVNDGSRDRTPEFLDRLASRNPAVRVVHLSRNFGHQAAVTAGLDHARGQAVIVMDGDLQDPPEVLPAFIERWREGFDVVYAVRTKRKEGWLKRAGYFAFYRLMRAVADVPIPLDSGDFCLMDRTVVDHLNRMPERQRFMRGLRTFVGFRQTGVAYERAAREAGVSKYSFAKLVNLALDGIINFSSWPLKFVTGLGVAVGGTGLLAGVTLCGVPWVSGEPVVGWLAVVSAVLAVGGVQLMALGLVGEYVRRIFVEVKGRPTYIVSEVRPLRQETAPPSSRPARAG